MFKRWQGNPQERANAGGEQQQQQQQQEEEQPMIEQQMSANENYYDRYQQGYNPPALPVYADAVGAGTVQRYRSQRALPPVMNGESAGKIYYDGESRIARLMRNAQANGSSIIINPVEMAQGMRDGYY